MIRAPSTVRAQLAGARFPARAARRSPRRTCRRRAARRGRRARRRAAGPGRPARSRPAGERPDRNALEHHRRVVGELLEHRREVARADAGVEAPHVLVQDVHVPRDPRARSVHDAVDPPVAAAIRLPLHALLDPADTLRVPLRPLVEAVDLHLQTVEAEVEDQVALEEARGLSPRCPPRKSGWTASRSRCAMRLRMFTRLKPIVPGGRHRRRRRLDHEAPERVRIALLLLELARAAHRGRTLRPAAGYGRTSSCVKTLEQEVDVVAGRTPNANAAAARSRLLDRRLAPHERRTAPEPRATPTMISASPPRLATVIGSPSRTAP